MVVRCNILDSLSSVDAVGDGRGGYAPPKQHWPAESDARINGDQSFLARRDGGDEGIEPCGKSRRIPFDSLEVLFKDPAHRELAGRRKFDEFAVAFKK